jgi:Tfp pilus assembly protein PilF
MKTDPHLFRRAEIPCSWPNLLAIFACVLSFGNAMSAFATPYIPQDEKQVLERLPDKSSSTASRQLKQLRQRLAADPTNAALAAELADSYYRIAQRQGDPRYIGYAQSVLAPWHGKADAPDEILLARALVTQFLHDFGAAKQDLDIVLTRHPGHPAALSIRAILQLVQADFAGALTDCQALARANASLVALACEPTVRAVTGEARTAYEELQAALHRHRQAPVNERLWVLTRLAEIAQRMGEAGRAEKHFREALTLGVGDQYLLAVFAEFLLDQKRPQEAIALLHGETRNDVLLFRLALAEKLAGAAQAGEHEKLIAARIGAARMRGDKLHLSDEAQFELHFRADPQAALRLAQENWASRQREPSDVRLLLETALAAGDAGAAAPALAWIRETRHEDPLLLQLAARLQGAAK